MKSMDGLKLLLVFAFVLVLLWRRVPLFRAVLSGTLLMAVAYDMSLPALFRMAWQATTSEATIQLEVILVCIMLLEHILNHYGYLERMLKGLQGLFHDRRLLMALLPAFIGLMPSAGGALFSAPLVGQATAGTAITPEYKSFANYYYRHIWEYFLPLYPGVILASKLSGVPLPLLVPAMMPYGLLMILFGLPVLSRVRVENEAGQEITHDRMAMARELLSGIWPLLAVVTLVLFFRLDVYWAAGAVLVALFLRHRPAPRALWLLVREAVKMRTLILVWGIMVFKEALVDTGAVHGLPSLLAGLPVPDFVVLGLLSLMTGVLTGIVTGFVGITFPLAAAAYGGTLSLPLTVFLYIAGFTGQMLTPMHLCLAFTVDYFKADLHKVIRMSVGPIAALLSVAVAAFLFVH